MKLIVPPDNASYSVEFGQESLRAELDGGAGRYRKDVLHGSDFVQAQWVLDRAGYDYIMAFYRTISVNGSLPFEVELIVEGADLGERTCHFLPGSMRLTGQKGLAHFVSATLEVHAVLNPDQTEDDMGIIEAYNTAHGYAP